ncbi:MAG: SRPBCC domain-containing protein [Pirellulales bacterium]
MVASAEPEAVQHLRIVQETLIAAPLEIAYEALLLELGSEFAPGDKPMPMVLEAWPGGRWFRDLGNQAGHFWGHVQVIKPPTLIEISGPLFMSYAASNHVQYRLRAEGDGAKLTFTHTSIGLIDPEHRQGVNSGWSACLKRIGTRAAAAAKK